MFQAQDIEFGVYGKLNSARVIRSPQNNRNCDSIIENRTQNRLEANAKTKSLSASDINFLAKSTASDPENIFFLKQEHGNKIHSIPKTDHELDHKKNVFKETIIPKITNQNHHSLNYYDTGDAIYTQEKKKLLLIYTADCLPLFVIMENNKNKLVGLVHAGWRGFKKKIVYLALQKMLKQFISTTKNKSPGIIDDIASLKINFLCGPAASASAYIVGQDVAKYFSTAALNEIFKTQAISKIIEKSTAPSGFELSPHFYKKIDKNSYLLDLVSLTKLQILAVLVDYASCYNLTWEDFYKNIYYRNDLEDCTIQNNKKFYSHRCQDTARNLNYIKILA